MLWLILTSVVLASRLKNKKAVFLVLNLIPMAVVAGLRADSVGTDLRPLYITIFRSGDAYSWYAMYDVEMGWLVLADIMQGISSSEILYLLVMATITYGLIGLSFYKSSKSLYMSLLLFLGMGMYCTSFNAMRQYMAAGFLCLAYTKLLDEKIKQALILVTVACAFHRSALVMLPLIILYRFLNSQKRYYFFSFLAVAGIWLMGFGYQQIAGAIPKYANLYIDSEYADARAIGLWFILALGAILYYIWINFKTTWLKYSFDKIRSFNAILLLIYALIIISSYKINILSRLNIYFELFLCFVIPFFFSFHKTKNNIIANVIITILMVGYLSVFLAKGSSDVVPYIMRI